MYCNNCGKTNHIFKECLLPKISMGVILYTYREDTLYYLLVRRKDTIGYIEFLRGKYIKHDIQYIQTLVNQMTIHEQQRLLNDDFDTLWDNVWMIYKFKKKRKFNYEFKNAKRKFNELKSGYSIENIEYSIETFIKNTDTKWKEPEWGFPKGKRNRNELDIDAAKRECIEETGIPMTEFIIYPNRTFTENYIGSDNNQYRHIYYIGEYIGDSLDTTIDTENKYQVSEISKVGFYTLAESGNMIRDYYMEKKNVLKQVNNYLIQNITT